MSLIKKADIYHRLERNSHTTIGNPQRTNTTERQRIIASPFNNRADYS